MMISEFLINQHPYPFRLILVGSHTPFVGSEYGVMRDGEFTQIINDQAGQLKHMKVLVDALGKLGRYYLSLLNRETLNEMVIAQVELIAESLGQLRSIEMFQEFFAATGSFWQWGMGSGHFPAFINVFSLFDPAKYDYVLLYLWEPKALENHYISKMFNDINRNTDGMRIMAVHEKMQYTLPESIAEHADLMSFAARLREMTGTEMAFCDWKGRRHLLMGLKCNYLRTSICSAFRRLTTLKAGQSKILAVLCTWPGEPAGFTGFGSDCGALDTSPSRRAAERDHGSAETGICLPSA